MAVGAYAGGMGQGSEEKRRQNHNRENPLAMRTRQLGDPSEHLGPLLEPYVSIRSMSTKLAGYAQFVGIHETATSIKG
jgi:hypothetical protein